MSGLAPAAEPPLPLLLTPAADADADIDADADAAVGRPEEVAVGVAGESEVLVIPLAPEVSTKVVYLA